MQYNIIIPEKHAEFIKKNLTDQVTSITPYKEGLMNVGLNITNNVDLVVIFFAGVDYGIQEAASIIKR
jgi:hypothetical protein